MDRGTIIDNLERCLQGENLEFYKNIEDLKILTANAKALIARSNTIFRDIVEKRELKTLVRATDDVQVDSDSIGNLLSGQCRKCGLVHGAHGYCVLHEIIKAEKVVRASPKRSSVASILLDISDDSSESLEPSQRTLDGQSSRKLRMLKKEPSKDQIDKWENLLYQKMTPEELKREYRKICLNYGKVNGEKFLYARSLALEGPKKVKHLRKGDDKIAPITEECVPAEKPSLPCTEISADWHNKMASLLDPVSSCEFKPPKWERDWKNALKMKPMSEEVKRLTIEDDLSVSPGSSSTEPYHSQEMCSCGFRDCDCGFEYKCKPPDKKCEIWSDHHNNYLYTIREKLRKRRLLQGKHAPDEYHQLLKWTSKEISCDILRKDSELMMTKAYEIQQKRLKKCVASAIDKEDADLDKNISTVAELTSFFTRPDDRAWDRWIEGFRTQEDIDEDLMFEGVSGDSEIPSSCCSATTSTTENEFKHFQSTFGRIPFADEPLRLTEYLRDYFFDKIYARFRRSIQKSPIMSILEGYQKNFISNVSHLKCSDNIGCKVLDRLNLHLRRMKKFIPKRIARHRKLKRLGKKNREIMRKIRRRNYLEGIQLGKRYRLPEKSIEFKEDGGFVGFEAKDRKLLQEPKPKRFNKRNVDTERILLSKKRIRYQYRLLRTLFNGTMKSADKESLMDEGMKERLDKFKKTLPNTMQSHFETDSGTEDEDEDVSILKTEGDPTKRSLKIEEQKLTKPKPGCFADNTKLNHNSCHSFDGGNASSLSKKPHKNSYCRQSSHQMMDGPSTTAQFLQGKSAAFSNKWGNYISSLSEANKASQQSSRRLTPVAQTNLPAGTCSSNPNLSTKSANKDSSVQWEAFHLPTPPLSESGSEDFNFETLQPRVPNKEEAHMEKSARTGTRTNNKRFHEKLGRLEESELTDESSDSYVPKLLKIPPKRTSTNSVSQAHRGRAYRKSVKVNARAPCLSDSSSTDTEPIDYQRNSHRKRAAWDHKSGLHRTIAPYLDSATKGNQNTSIFSSGSRTVDTQSKNVHNRKSWFTSPLPKAGPSILKKRSLPKPPSDGVNENPSKTRSEGIGQGKQELFYKSCGTRPHERESLVRPGHVVTERLLKAPQAAPTNLAIDSGKKPSAQSRATPDSTFGSVGSSNTLKKKSNTAFSGKPAAIQRETQDDPLQPVKMPNVSSSLVNQGSASPTKLANGSDKRSSAQSRATPEAASGSAGSPSAPKEISITALIGKSTANQRKTQDDHARQQSSSPAEATGSLVSPSQSNRADVAATTSSKKLIKRASEMAGDAFRPRSIVAPDQAVPKEAKSKSGKKAVGEKDSQLQASNSSLLLKLKRLEAIGPTKKRYFGLDIGQGINCVNYLKEHAPTADEMQRRDLADLLMTPVNAKPASKKKVEKEESSSEAASVGGTQSPDVTSGSAVVPSKVSKRIHDQSGQDDTPLRRTSFKTIDQIYKEVHGINEHNTPKQFVENDYEYESKKKQQLKKHKILV